MKRFVLLSALSVLTLSACTTYDAYTHEPKTAKSSSGAAIGALSGAALGALVSSGKDRGKGALIGAASGAALGGGIGYYMDQQEAKLRQQLANTGVSVTRQGNDIILNMPNSITFDTGKSQIKPQGANTLTGVATVLKEFDRTAINVIGHTDNTGGAAVNDRVSKERAESVASALIIQGVDSRRIQMYGAGPKYPLASNSSPEGRAQNRRVELTLSPL